MGRTVNTGYEEQRITHDYWNGFQTVEMEWLGHAATLHIETPSKTIDANVFALERKDNPLSYFGRNIGPKVVRFVFEDEQERVDDFVMYDADWRYQETATEYRLPRSIDDPVNYFRGEWPVPYAFMNHDATNYIRACAQSVSIESEIPLEVKREDGIARISNRGQVELSELGTPPFYQVMPLVELSFD